ncbi:MAG: Unknown protein [uncultured Sulfurovum sp.]|uniref:Uncharacterized protein n=1 Tax=uncultured Sulfurovum sp. TaxID=269237 RepID=A0A6S6UCM8_9BACT|nr:MAG: Unknown protein [uncultured Sulfurovum sp.]
MAISRILLYEASRAKSLFIFLAAFIFFSIWLSVSFVISENLSGKIVFNLCTQMTKELNLINNNNINSNSNLEHQAHWLSLFIIPLMLPLIIYMTVFIVGIISKILLVPAQNIIIKFLYIIIKYDRYLYFISGLILFSAIKVNSIITSPALDPIT